MEMNMSNGNDGEKRRLTPNDPIPPEQIKQFTELAEARATIANNLLQLEQDKIYLLASAKQIDEQHRRLFQAVLTERGMAPDTQVEVDGETGKLTVKTPDEPGETPKQDNAEA
jgi:hypothetical protein